MYLNGQHRHLGKADDFCGMTHDDVYYVIGLDRFPGIYGCHSLVKSRRFPQQGNVFVITIIFAYFNVPLDE